MAPGPNGGGGRPTGTVPKTKTFISPRYLPGSPPRSDQGRNHVSNNLVSLDFQPVSESGNRKSRKRSNTQPSSLEYFDYSFPPTSINNMDVTGEAVYQDNSSCDTSCYASGDTDEVTWRRSHSMNGHDGSVSSDRRERTPQNVRPERETKSTNMTKVPDRNQVVSRLNQIRDYIKQTTSLVDTLRNSGDPRQLSQAEKLSKLVLDLEDSEMKLQRLLNTMDRVSADLERHEREMLDESYEMQRFSQLLEVLQAQESNLNKSWSPVEHKSNSVSLRENYNHASPGGKKSNSAEKCSEPYGAVLKSSDSTRRNELKIKVEESQRKLQALQDHQAALLALQQKFQDQLQTARAAQGILAANTDSSDDHMTQEKEDAGCSVENLRDLDYRLNQLAAICDTRNELEEFLGPGDEDVETERMDLTDKLRELQSKKHQLDALVSQFQALNGDPSGLNTQTPKAREYNENNSHLNYSARDANENSVSSDSDRKSVRDKVAELNFMKAELARLQGLSEAISKTERLRYGDAVAVRSTDGNEQEEAELEEQAINLRRQKEKARSSVARSNSIKSTSSSKQDNITQATSEIEKQRELERNAIKLQEARNRYQNLQQLLSVFSEAQDLSLQRTEDLTQLLNEGAVARDNMDRNVVRSISATHIPSRLSPGRILRQVEDLQSIECNNSSVDEPQDVTVDMIHAMADELRQQTMTIRQERERLANAQLELAKLQPVREKKTNAQMNINSQQHLLAATLRSKRKELEELMKKDQGQSSSVNQDVCSVLSVDKSEAQAYSFLAEGTTNATWGGSVGETIDDFAEQDNELQDHSAEYTSDEGLDEEEDEDVETNENFPTSQLKISQLKNSANNSNISVSSVPVCKDVLGHSSATNRELLNMSLDSGHTPRSSAVNTPPPPPAAAVSSRQGSCNIWRKDSTDTVTQMPRPQRISASRQDCESNNLNPNVHNTVNETNNNVSQSTNASSAANNILHQQHQINAANGIYQNMLHEYNSQHNNGANFPPNIFAVNPFWPSVSPMICSPIQTPPPNSNSDFYYQQLLTISQLQQQHMLFSTVNQCCHLLWLQQRELASLRTSMQSLNDKLVLPTREGSSLLMGPPLEQLPSVTPVDNNVQGTSHMSHSNLARHPQSSNINSSSVTSPGMKPSLSSMFRPASNTGVSSAHSLPNLTQNMIPNVVVHEGMLPNNICENSNASAVVNPLESGYTQNYIPNCQASNIDPINHSYMPNEMAFGFPTNNLNYCSPQALMQHTSGTSWLQQATNNTPMALNNQVPPGNRANNYWDNFRSYSRQNLLSTNTKVNDTVSHSPSPLVDRSHNSLHAQATSSSSQPSAPLYNHTEQGLSSVPTNRKDNINLEQYQDMYTLPGISSSVSPHLSCLPACRCEIINNENTQSSQHNTCDTHPKIRSDLFSSHAPCPPERSVVTSEQNVKSSSTGATKKKKYAKTSVPVNTNVQGSESSSKNTSQDRNSENLTLFDILRDPVYTEVAALISVNENRPHFLIQLFRDLQMISSDSLRQRILQAIHELVSQYLRSSHCEEETENQNGRENASAVSHQNQADNAAIFTSDRGGDEDKHVSASVFLLPGSPSQVLSRYGYTNLLNRKDTSSCVECLQQNEKVAAALTSSPVKPSTHNTMWNRDSLNSSASGLTTGVSKLDWEVQAVLVDLRPFLKAHSEDTCSPGFLETVRKFALQLLPIQNLPLTSINNSPGQQGVSYFQSQIDALLEDALLKFQGNRLGDVDDELLSVISDILQSELTFLRHISRAASCGENLSVNKMETISSNSQLEESINLCSSSSQSSRPLSQPTQDNTTRNYQCAASNNTATESYNGDLAEADQSRHTGIDVEPEAESATDVTEEEQISQAEGIVLLLTDDEIVAQIKEEEVSDEEPKTAIVEEWEVEEDRSLDQVPSRLETATEAVPDSSPTHSDSSSAAVPYHESPLP